MLTYTGSRNLFGTLAGDSSTGTLTLADTLINESIRRILGSRRWPFLFRQFTLTMTGGTQFKELPANCGRVFSVYVTSGTTRHTPKEAPSREFWEKLNQSTSVSSDFPEYWYVFDGQLGFYPKLASSLTATINALRKHQDLNVADYTTGNIDVITNGSTSVTGAGTPNWTTPMAGRFLRVTHSNTAASSGDGRWYEISSVGSSTTLTLVKSYTGTSLTTGAAAAYTIGQASLLPEEYQILPIYDALRQFFISVKPEPERAREYSNLYRELYNSLILDWGSNTKNPVLDDGEEGGIINPNLSVTL